MLRLKVHMASSVDGRLIHERETRLAALDASIARGLADADAGRVHDIDEVAAMLDARYAAAERLRDTQ